MHITGIQRKFAILIIVIFSVVCVTAFMIWNVITSEILHKLGTDYTLRTVVWQTEKTESLINREVTLARKLADSPLLKQWCLNEENPLLKKQALAELNSYTSVFRDKSSFFIIDKSKHYYFGDEKSNDKGYNLQYTLDPSSSNDKWYFTTVATINDYALNVDHSSHLNTTKVWINIIIKDNSRTLGMAGTGIDLSDFINTLINTHESGVSTIMFDRKGIITGHRNSKYLSSSASGYNKSSTSIYCLITSAKDQKRLKQIVIQSSKNPSKPFTCDITIGNQRYLAAAAYMPSINWFDLVLINRDSLFGSHQFYPMLLVMVFALLALLLGTAITVNRLIINPLSLLTISVQNVSSKQYDISDQESRSDEIGQLAKAFNYMSMTVKRHTDNLENLVQERTKELRQVNTELEEKNKHISDSIEYATIIQGAVLPPQKLLSKCFDDHFSIWKPRDNVGGDAYFAHEVDEGILLALVDCTGHGVPGALMTMSASAILQHHISDMKSLNDPSSLLHDINCSIRSMLGHDAHNDAVPTGMEMGICIYKPKDNKLVFSGARIDLWYHDGNKLHEIPGDRRSLGYNEPIENFKCTNHIIDIVDNFRFYITTDGWLDQSGYNTDGRGFGKRAFRHMLESCYMDPFSEQTVKYIQILEQFKGDTPQRDDITLIGFSIDKK